MGNEEELLVAVIMGSRSDWDTMAEACETLEEFGIPHECRVLSAHRTPAQLVEYVKLAEERGCTIFIAGAGGAAHLAGVIAAHTIRPVLGVPIESTLSGLDSLLSIVQMPTGIPVGTLGIGRSGATNAALLAIAFLATSRPELREKLQEYREKRAKEVLEEPSLRRGRAGFRR